MTRKSKQIRERKVSADFSEAVKIDTNTMSRIVEIVLDKKLKGHFLLITLIVIFILSLASTLYMYLF